MKRVDCPHCGAQLDPALVETQAQIQCGKCGRQLRLMRKRDLRAAKGQATPSQSEASAPSNGKTAVTSAPTDPKPSPQAVGVRPDSLLPPPTRVPIPGPPVEVPGESPIAVPPSITLEARPTISTENLLEDLARRKSRNRLWMFLTLVALTASSSATIAYLLGGNSAKQSSGLNEVDDLSVSVDPNALAASKVESQPQAAADEPASESNPVSESELAQPQVAPESPLPAEQPLAWGELNSVGRRDMEKLWAQLHPYVFRLVVTKSESKRTISGLLLDSRGCLVTSLAAIEGATSIVAAPAPSDPLGDLPADALKDEVRGVLAVDRAHDLVLLQINRRLVNVVSGLQPSDKLLVPGRWLIQTAAVGPERVGWVTESKVKEGALEKFPEAVQQLIERRGIDLGPYWPQHQLQLNCGAGAGLFIDDGRLAGINTGLKHEGGQLLAEAKAVFELLKQAKEPAAPLSSLVNASKAAGQGTVVLPGGEDNAGNSAVLSGPGAAPFLAGHEAEPIASRLATAGLACEAFGWLPAEDGTQPAELAGALTAWREARDLLRGRRLFPEDAKLLSRQVAHWTSRINATILSLNREQSAELNRKAWASLKGESAQTLVLFVRVVLQPGTSPRLAGADTATLQLLGSEQYLIVEVNSNTAPLLPDSEWLVVATIDPQAEVLVTPQPDRQAQARKAKDCKEILEVKSIGFRVAPLEPKPDRQNPADDR